MSLVGVMGDYDLPRFRHALEVSWLGGEEVVRYGRRWRISKPNDMGDDYWSGHLGFVDRGAFSTLHWDAQTLEFRRDRAPGGVIVPFIVNVRERVVSFQLTSHTVKVNTVTGNLRALLNIGDGPYVWRISPRMAGESYEQWRASVSRITKIHIKLEYPNPNWVDRETLRQMFGDLHAHAVEIKAQADEGDGLDLDGRLGTELLDHIRHEYGTAVFEGLDQKTGTKRRYKGTFAGPSDPLIDKIPSPEHGEEDSPERLRAVQREHLAELGWTGDDSRADGSGVGR